MDGIGACDHTYAADSVKGYAKVSKKSEDNLGPSTHNSGIGKGHSASDTAKNPEVVIGAKTLHATKLCCLGDTVIRHLDVIKVEKESGRKVENGTCETRVDLRRR